MALENEFIDLTSNGSQNAEGTIKHIQQATLMLPPPAPPGAPDGSGAARIWSLRPRTRCRPARPEFN